MTIPKVVVVETQGDFVSVSTPQPVQVVNVGNVGGPTGPAGKWVSMTAAQFTALPVKDPDTLYVIIG